MEDTRAFWHRGQRFRLRLSTRRLLLHFLAARNTRYA